MQILNKLPAVVNCLPFIGPVISIVKCYSSAQAEDHRQLLQVASILKTDGLTPKPETIQRATNNLNNQLYGIIGSLATVVSVIALALLGMIALPGAVVLGIPYLTAAVMSYYFYDAIRHDYKEILSRN